jgi:kumamolisin
MAIPKNYVRVQGSERTALPGARVVGPADSNERVEVTVHVRPRSAAPLPIANMTSQSRSTESRSFSRSEFRKNYGADPADLAKVAAFAREHGLEVVESNPARRSMVLAGTVSALSAAFGVELHRYEIAGSGETFRGRQGAVHIPRELEPIVEGIFGLDNRPQARPHFRILAEPEMTAASSPPSRAAQPRANGFFTPLQIAQLYNFPAGFDGRGQCIALIELGGGYHRADLKTYFAELGLPLPKISWTRVDRGANHPVGNPNSADGEVLLDIEVAGATAPKARIVVYFAPNTDRGFLDAITTAIHDTRRKPSIISISWGAPEVDWTAQALQAFDRAFQEAALLGITVFCASGDSGSNDGIIQDRQHPDRLAHVDFPASSPYVVGCGGTQVNVWEATISQEVAWNDGPTGGATGGGVSDFFSLPSFQTNAGIPRSINPGRGIGRGVPDVAGDASPRSGYLVRVDGQEFPVGGTSAVAPLWAGLTARLNQALGRPIGFFNPFLYQFASMDVFHDITSGDNDITNTGGYIAGPGWDACTGFGSPDGAKLLQVLRSEMPI